MEPNEIQAALSAAVEEVLETMCFTTVLAYEPGPAQTPPSAETPLPAEAPPPPVTLDLRFAGNPSGRFRVGLPASLARMLAVAFLGREPEEVSDSEAVDVAGELSNMICGSVLSRLESKSIFQITHPELVPSGAAFGDCDSARFDLGDGILTVSLQLQPAV